MRPIVSGSGWRFTDLVPRLSSGFNGFVKIWFLAPMIWQLNVFLATVHTVRKTKSKTNRAQVGVPDSEQCAPGKHCFPGISKEGGSPSISNITRQRRSASCRSTLTKKHSRVKCLKSLDDRLLRGSVSSGTVAHKPGFGSPPQLHLFWWQLLALILLESFRLTATSFHQARLSGD